MSEATIQFQGRLTGEPQQNQAGNYQVVNFNVAVDGSRRDAPKAKPGFTSVKTPSRESV